MVLREERRWCTYCHHYVANPLVGSLASPGRRLGAYVVDVAIPTLGCFLLFILLSAVEDAEGTPRWVVVEVGTLLLVMAYVVWMLVEFARGRTLGKSILGMYVVMEDGRRAGFFTMLVREWIGKWISGFFFGLGFLWILLDREHQGWHDKLMRTYVVKKATTLPLSLGAMGDEGVSRATFSGAGDAHHNLDAANSLQR